MPAVIYVNWTRPSNFYKFSKRTMDIGLSFAGLVLLSPVIALTAAIIKVSSPGPIIFVQKRVGERGKLFDLFKFRSMVVDAESKKSSLAHLNERDGPVFKIENDPRITKFGRFIRKYAIDELPQLFNILIGDMSLVGPRPATPDEVAKYSAFHKQRLNARPGLTCLWQIDPGKDALSFDQWVGLDVEYISKRSCALDITLILKTIPYILLGGHKA